MVRTAWMPLKSWTSQATTPNSSNNHVVQASTTPSLTPLVNPMPHALTRVHPLEGECRTHTLSSWHRWIKPCRLEIKTTHIRNTTVTQDSPLGTWTSNRWWMLPHRIKVIRSSLTRQRPAEVSQLKRSQPYTPTSWQRRQLSMASAVWEVQ